MKLAVLHLSDIHFHGDDDAVFHRSTEIAESVFPAVRQSNACLIAITGDIAYGGASEEYAAAQKIHHDDPRLLGVRDRCVCSHYHGTGKSRLCADP